MHNLLPRNRIIKMDLSLGAELDDAVCESKKGMIFAHADVVSGKDVSAALAHNNSAGASLLAVIDLDAEVFRVRVAAVLG